MGRLTNFVNSYFLLYNSLSLYQFVAVPTQSFIPLRVRPDEVRRAVPPICITYSVFISSLSLVRHTLARAQTIFLYNPTNMQAQIFLSLDECFIFFFFHFSTLYACNWCSTCSPASWSEQLYWLLVDYFLRLYLFVVYNIFSLFVLLEMCKCLLPTLVNSVFQVGKYLCNYMLTQRSLNCH